MWVVLPAHELDGAVLNHLFISRPALPPLGQQAKTELCRLTMLTCQEQLPGRSVLVENGPCRGAVMRPPPPCLCASHQLLMLVGSLRVLCGNLTRTFICEPFYCGSALF